MAFVRPGPRIAMIVRATTNGGIASSASAMRDSTLSSRPLIVPASSPSGNADRTATVTACNGSQQARPARRRSAAREHRGPCRRCPTSKSPLGPSSARSSSCSLGSCGARSNDCEEPPRRSTAAGSSAETIWAPRCRTNRCGTDRCVCAAADNLLDAPRWAAVSAQARPALGRVGTSRTHSFRTFGLIHP